jgi:hypothetical protein
MEKILTMEESLKYYNDSKYREELKDKQITLYLMLLDEIKDVSVFRNVHTLKLTQCDQIKDVSALRNVHTLDLSYCEGITDVSALGNVYSLQLSGCYGIKNVCALKNVHILNLSNCYKIKDVSELINVEKLISETVNGINLLNNIKTIITDKKIKKGGKGEINKLKKKNNKIEIKFKNHYDCFYF